MLNQQTEQKNEKGSQPLGAAIFLPAIFVFILGILLSQSAFHVSRSYEDEHIRNDFTQYALAQSLRIQGLIERSTMLSTSFAGLFEARTQPSREEYRLFTNIVLEKHPEITAVHWAPRIPDTQRAHYEARLASLGLAPLGIFDVSEEADAVIRAPSRHEYFPIFYAEPLEPNRKAVGLDPLARPFNTTTIRDAAKNGTKDTTQPFPIVQDPDGPLAVAMYHPIYNHGKPINTPTERWNALEGYIILMLRPEILLLELQDASNARDIGMKLFDVSAEEPIQIYPRVGAGTVSTDTTSPNVADTRSPSATASFPLHVPGRKWMLELHASHEFLSANRSQQPWLLLAALLALTLMIVVLMAKSSRHAKTLSVLNAKLVERQKVLDELAYFDALTGLPNRLLLNDRLKIALSSEHRLDSFSAICVMDLDEFKEINDCYGHHVGDLVLKTVAERLQSFLRESDTAARVGGDEFVLLLPGFSDGERLRELFLRIISGIGEPILLPNGIDSVQVSTSIGVALSDNSDRNIKAILQNADSAMYQAKRAGKGQYCVYGTDRARIAEVAD
ncbi:MAG: diguanylate cyclase [Oceanospirillaceae bacterium]|nr:diguanylate cyclase [Oceanospirillaceae bacterium]